MEDLGTVSGKIKGITSKSTSTTNLDIDSGFGLTGSRMEGQEVSHKTMSSQP